MTREVENSDRELYREEGDDYWSNGIWLVERPDGPPGIAIKWNGHVISMPLRAWYACGAAALSASGNDGGRT